MITIISKICHFIVWLVYWPVFKFFFSFKIIGKENLKELEGPLIIVFNHASALDPFFIMAGVGPFSPLAPIRFAVWHGHFFNPLYLPFLWLYDAFPVRKGVGLKKTLKKPKKVLEKRGVVGIAPEGKRRHYGRPRKGRRGAAYLAIKTNAPLVPVYIEGTLGFEPDECVLRKRQVTMVIGEKFYLPLVKIKKASDLNEPSDFIRDKIFDLEKRIENIEKNEKKNTEQIVAKS